MLSNNHNEIVLPFVKIVLTEEIYMTIPKILGEILGKSFIFGSLHFHGDCRDSERQILSAKFGTFMEI